MAEVTINVFAAMGKGTHGTMKIIYDTVAETFTVEGLEPNDFVETGNTKSCASGDKAMLFKVDIP